MEAWGARRIEQVCGLTSLLRPWLRVLIKGAEVSTPRCLWSPPLFVAPLCWDEPYCGSPDALPASVGTEGCVRKAGFFPGWWISGSAGSRRGGWQLSRLNSRRRGHLNPLPSPPALSCPWKPLPAWFSESPVPCWTDAGIPELPFLQGR